MKFAHVRGSKIVGITWQEGSTPPAGCVVLPVVVEPKPLIDQNTQELDSFYQVSPDRKFVACLYVVQDKAPEPERPPGSTVIVQQVSQPVDMSVIDAQVAALQAAVAEMQTARHVGELIFIISNGAELEARAALAKLEPIAARAGRSVEQYVAEFIARRDAAAEAALRGAA